MSRPKRKVMKADETIVAWAIADLNDALKRLKVIGAKRTADKVRRAIKSAGGAQRHILRLMREQERGE